MTTRPDAAYDLIAVEFKNLGLGRMAYVRTSVIDGRVGYTINAADGSFLGSLWDREEAIVECRLNDLEPMIVH